MYLSSLFSIFRIIFRIQIVLYYSSLIYYQGIFSCPFKIRKNNNIIPATGIILNALYFMKLINGLIMLL